MVDGNAGKREVRDVVSNTSAKDADALDVLLCAHGPETSKARREVASA